MVVLSSESGNSYFSANSEESLICNFMAEMAGEYCLLMSQKHLDTSCIPLIQMQVRA